MTNNQVTIRDYITAPAVQKKMGEMFTDQNLLKQFTQSIIALAGSDELLATAEPRSVFNACMIAASLGLPINKSLGMAHVIGYNNNKKGIVEAQFQIGVKGLRQLAQRSGQYVFLNDGDIREGELKSRNRLTGEINFDWLDDDEIRNNLPVVGYFSYFELKSGFKSTLYMTMEEIKMHATHYSQSYKRGYGPWVDNFDAMARKTVTKLNINKNGPMNTELQRAIEVDQAVISDDGRKYVDNDSDLEDVKATEDQKNDIINAHTIPDNVDPETGEVTDDIDNVDLDAAMSEADKNVKGVGKAFGKKP